MESPIPAELIRSVVVPNCGALFLAVPFASLFYGVTVLQTYLYYDRYADDPLYLKLFVAVISLCDTAQLVFVIYSAWWYLIPNYGNLASIELLSFGIAAETIMTTVLGLFVQCFFAHRVWIMSRNAVLPFIITALSLLQFAFGIYYVVMIQRSGTVLVFAQLVWCTAVGLSCSMASNLVITLALCYYLRKIRSGMSKTDKLIRVLVIYTVNTGLITSVVGIFAITISSVFSKTNWLVIPFSLVSKCYVNTTLATLNARIKLRNMPAGAITMTSDGVQFTTDVTGRIRAPGIAFSTGRHDSGISGVHATHCLDIIRDGANEDKPSEDLFKTQPFEVYGSDESTV
ncbi:hypothetical protein CERSUDRAFT_119942 [Gelatoporia subvermispora B]|uniref:DUF6534 domain-containing protein n=1 Tax=Ceriporiopsis subvermispora (strain B) TaxID=914234 RepID=M2Q364_CERS8|nr:hypothetical protein CERSUDRAFT_119942 [Gelatoporia subvermispora B]